MKDGEAIVVRDTTQLTEWSGAAQRALANKRERDQLIAEALTEGNDYGVIPGTDKPTLLKPGAEKISDALNLYAEYDFQQATEDFDRPLFYYRIKCSLKTRASDTTVATGEGSCSSMESRYRWRKAERLCPACNAPAIIKGKEEYGGGWLCWAKRGGCGAKFDDSDEQITGQATDRVPNPDLCDQFNTILKIAQKRALVAATLGLGLSDTFTQDMEDLPVTATVAPQKATEEVDPVPQQTTMADIDCEFSVANYYHGKKVKTFKVNGEDRAVYDLSRDDLAAKLKMAREKDWGQWIEAIESEIERRRGYATAAKA